MYEREYCTRPAQIACRSGFLLKSGLPCPQSAMFFASTSLTFLCRPAIPAADLNRTGRPCVNRVRPNGFQASTTYFIVLTSSRVGASPKLLSAIHCFPQRATSGWKRRARAVSPFLSQVHCLVPASRFSSTVACLSLAASARSARNLASLALCCRPIGLAATRSH